MAGGNRHAYGIGCPERLARELKHRIRSATNVADSIDAAAVLVLARAQGQAWVDDEVAKRIAAAATTAVQAVNEALPQATPEMFSDSAADFLATLDVLAEPAP
jgi:actin-like ATPase involved in cell morphogenesis